MTWLPNPSHVIETRSDRKEEIDPLSQHFEPAEYTFTNVANATPEFGYISMDGFRGVSIHCVQTGGTDTFDIDYESSNEGSDATVDWIDSTTNGFETVGGANLQSDHIVAMKANMNTRGIRFEVTTAGGSDNADFTFFVKKWY